MVKKILTPFQKFVNIESFSGMLLFGATVIALFLANSPFNEQFQAIWNYRIGVGTSDFQLVKPLLHWINDLLMSVFFFLIGLEIKRELLIGELNSLKKATLPLFAAIGGMLFPVIIFLTLNNNPDTTRAWGVPMATDIAFSLAILTLLGNRVPIGLKVFLIAFAIVDDLGAVLVIAIFYSTSIKWGLILIAIGMLIILFILSYRSFYSKYLTLGVGAVVWLLFYKAGIHPTIAGVLVAFTVPIRQRINLETYIDKLCEIVANVQNAKDPKTPLLSEKQIEEVDNLEDWTEKVQSPLQHLEHKLHNWVAYLVMPVFALSNAGVVISGDAHMDLNLAGVIGIGLLLGKLVGITSLSWIGVKTGLAVLPKDVNFKQIIGTGLLAGVGFTMSIFVANLAFKESPGLLDSAKMGVLAGSLVAGISGYLVLRFNSKKKEEEEASAGFQE